MFFFRIATNVELTAGEAGPVRPGLRLACVTRRVSFSLTKNKKQCNLQTSKGSTFLTPECRVQVIDC